MSKSYFIESGVKMVLEFNEVRKTDDDMQNLFNALTECKVMNAEALHFSKGEYHFFDKFAFERAICISNHGENGFKKTGFLLENTENFIIDGGGSHFVFESVMNMVTVLGCKNITLKNFTVSMPVAPYPEGKVVAVTDGYFDVEFSYYSEIIATDSDLLISNGESLERAICNIEFNGETHEIEYGTGDQTAGAPLYILKKEKIGENIIRFYGASRKPKLNNVLALMIGRRYVSGLFIDNSEDIKIENVIINSCVGIGIMAQRSKNITVDGCAVTSAEDKFVSSGADATHFVGCSGKITVQNCLFEHMLDDALNVHGIYLKVIYSEIGKAVVKFCNSASTGFNLFNKGDKICEMDAKTLIPCTTATVLKSTKINNELIEIVLDEDKILKENNVIENLTTYPELTLKNSVIRNNRARGVLIATKHSVIENCDFHTSGAAVVLECDGRFWYESGAVEDILIKNNRFVGCKHGTWGNGVISVPKRESEVENKYYHGTVSITGNTFDNCFDDAVYADNIENFVYKDNVSNVKQVLHLNKIGKTDIQSDAVLK